MCAPSNGKPLNPKAESWKPEQGAKMEPRLPHQFFPPPPPPPQPPCLFLPTCVNNFYTLPPSENLPSYYYQTSAADGKYVYVDHQFVPLDHPQHYGYFSLSNFHNTPISYYYHPLQHPFIPKHPNAVQGMDCGSSEGDIGASSLGGKVIPEKNDSKMADYDLVAVKGNARDGGWGDTSRMIAMRHKKKGFAATVPPRFLRNGRSVKDGWYRTTNAANTRKSSRVNSLKWKPKCGGGGGGGGGVDQGVKKSVDSSDMASSYRNDDPLSSNNTTVMIKNIPNKFRRHSFINFLDRYCKDHNLEYDFIYLPMDFKRLDNLGYAFVNFTSASDAVRIRELLHNYKWGGCGVVVPTTSSPGYGPSKKICQVTWARIQGKDELVKHFELSAFACHTDEYLPAVLDPPRNGLTSFTIPKAIGKLKSPGFLYPRHLLRRKTNQ